MSGCPFKNFKPCPRHSEVGGCEFWMEYTGDEHSVKVSMKGCAITLTPMLLIENANNLGVVASEINKSARETSALRADVVRESETSRNHLVQLTGITLQRNKEIDV